MGSNRQPWDSRQGGHRETDTGHTHRNRENGGEQVSVFLDGTHIVSAVKVREVVVDVTQSHRHCGYAATSSLSSILVDLHCLQLLNKWCDPIKTDLPTCKASIPSQNEMKCKRSDDLHIPIQNRKTVTIVFLLLACDTAADMSTHHYSMWYCSRHKHNYAPTSTVCDSTTADMNTHHYSTWYCSRREHPPLQCLIMQQTWTYAPTSTVCDTTADMNTHHYSLWYCSSHEHPPLQFVILQLTWKPPLQYVILQQKWTINIHHYSAWYCSRNKHPPPTTTVCDTAAYINTHHYSVWCCSRNEQATPTTTVCDTAAEMNTQHPALQWVILQQKWTGNTHHYSVWCCSRHEHPPLQFVSILQ